ncbi:receptor-like protein kinase [Populus alba x Populus x berolinensis]|nr:receptor-like protein kinase [Populus alba x Populus x berolinensis]
MTKLKNCLKSLLKPFKFKSKEGLGEEDMETIAAREQKQFSFDTLVSATKDFHPTHKLGEGGFGPVYKGKLDDGREIAVKKLSHSSNQGKKEFTNEAKLLSRVQHRNVVNLLGYCAHGVEKLLVYEYVAHESLDKLLFKSDKRQLLDWNRRHDILIGIARGLLYLHEDSHNCIIHRDIKASNILLDDKWVPKIADFGMARLFPEDQTHVNTRVAGTNGYMAPEYVMHGHLSVKADVFSFGVLVLELISGQRNSTFSQQHSEAQNLLDWEKSGNKNLADELSKIELCPVNMYKSTEQAYKLHKKNRSLEIMDPVLASSAAAEQVKTCVHIGLLCTQRDPQLRPDMRRIVVLLSKKTCSLEEPARPGVPGSRYRRARRPAGMSSTAGTSDTARTFGESDSRTFDSSSNTNTTASTSAHTIPRLDPHGKRPIES